MDEQAKTTMLVCEGLEPREQEKVERLDGPIFRVLKSRVRFCRGENYRNRRVLVFYDLNEVIRSLAADIFLGVTDNKAVEIIGGDNQVAQKIVLYSEDGKVTDRCTVTIDMAGEKGEKLKAHYLFTIGDDRGPKSFEYTTFDEAKNGIKEKVDQVRPGGEWSNW